MSPLDQFVLRFLLASAGCLAAGLGVWVLTLVLRRVPGLQLQRSTWLLGQLTIVAAFLVMLLPHGERLRIVPPIDIEIATSSLTVAAAPAGRDTAHSAPAPVNAQPAAGEWLVYGAQAWLVIYLLGLAYAMFKLLHARRLLCALAAAGSRVSDLQRHPGLSRVQGGLAGLEVIEVDAPISPMLFGLFRPRLLLPRHLRSFEEMQQHLIVQHELTHLRRHDLHWMSAGLLLHTLLWFNPCMQVLRKHLCWAQELGCDRDVLNGRAGTARKAYAAALVAQLKTQHRQVNAALAFGGVSASTVAERIALIRQPAAAVGRGWTRIAVLVALALVAGASLALQPALAWRSDPAGVAPAATLSCFEMTDAASGVRLVHDGQCDERVTPASTFNIVVSLMGYDSGILIDERTPALPFKEGYPDWIAAWRATIDPTGWIRHSVLWYAQQVMARLGAQRFAHYVEQFNYGNRDVSGDPGKNNGLELSWVGSSLKISPAEQVDFLRKVVNRSLPVSARAYDMTSRIMVTEKLANGWEVYGKTGTANPVLPDGRDDETRQYGWYVGWAKKGERTVVFIRMVLDARQESHAGWRVKQAFLREFPTRIDTLNLP